MSYPGYPSHGSGGAGPTYPPYPNSSCYQPPPQHATASLSYPNVGFNAQSPSQTSFSYPHTQPGAPMSYPHISNPSPMYPSSYNSSPYPPVPHQTHYPPSIPHIPPVQQPYPPQSCPYPTTVSSLPSVYPSSNPLSANTISYPPSPYPATYPCPTMASATATPQHLGHSSITSGAMSKGNPTVRPAHPFDPRSDAEVLRKAMKGFGTDEKAIIGVIAHRSNDQRQQIAFQFKTLYGKDLISDLKSELTGKLEDLIIALMKPRFEYLAKQVHQAISGLGTDEDVVIEVICTASNAELHAIKAAYHHLYNRALEEDLRSDTSGNFKRLLTSLCVGNRSEDYNVNPAAAEADAQALLRAGELRVGTDESTFNAVLSQRSYPQLQAVLMAYQRLTGHNLEKAIKKEFSGDIEKGLLTIVRCAENRPGFFAERLYKSMKGLGTDDQSLVRLVVSRCEVDMADIKQAFSSMYGKTLDSFISGDTSGDYKKCLLALIGAD